jgi:hypothetical protein
MYRNIENYPNINQKEEVSEYIENGRPLSNFLTAVVTNDLKESFGRADHINRRLMFDVVSWFWNYAPSECWGSKEKVAAWIRRGGVNGDDNGLS